MNAEHLTGDSLKFFNMVQKHIPTLLQINTTLNSGSTGRIAEQIALLAESKGWTCYIAHGARYVNPSQVKSFQIGTKVGNIIHAIMGEYLGMHGFGSTLATYWLTHRIKRIRPDVIHLHNLHGYYLNIAVLFRYLAKANIPIVWTLHDCWSFTGHCTHFENKGCYKWKTECNHCPQLMAQYKSRLVDRSRKNYRIKKQLYERVNNMVVVPVSQWLEGLVKDSILNGHEIRVIHNGIDLTLFKPVTTNLRVRLGIAEDKKMILGVVASGFKGKKEFIEMSKVPEFQVVVVGVNPKWMEGIPDNIICIPRTNSQRELAEYYSAADVFVNPTYDDTFPTTNIESLACGTPVVTYRAGGSPEIIDQYTGLAVERGDMTGLFDSIKIILCNGKQMYSDTCRKRAVDNYNKEERFRDYIELYNELVKTKRS